MELVRSCDVSDSFRRFFSRHLTLFLCLAHAVPVLATVSEFCLEVEESKATALSQQQLANGGWRFFAPAFGSNSFRLSVDGLELGPCGATLIGEALSANEVSLLSDVPGQVTYFEVICFGSGGRSWLNANHVLMFCRSL